MMESENRHIINKTAGTVLMWIFSVLITAIITFFVASFISTHDTIHELKGSDALMDTKTDNIEDDLSTMKREIKELQKNHHEQDNDIFAIKYELNDHLNDTSTLKSI